MQHSPSVSAVDCELRLALCVSSPLSSSLSLSFSLSLSLSLFLTSQLSVCLLSKTKTSTMSSLGGPGSSGDRATSTAGAAASSSSSSTTSSGSSTSLHPDKLDPTKLQPPSSGFVDKIDPFKKGSLKRKQRKSQGSSRYRLTSDVELQQLPLLKGMNLTIFFKLFLLHFTLYICIQDDILKYFHCLLTFT